MKVKSLSRVRLFVTPWTVPTRLLSMGFSRQGYWSGLRFPSPGDVPDPGIELRSPALRADALPSEPPGKPREREREREPSVEPKAPPAGRAPARSAGPGVLACGGVGVAGWAQSP